MTKKKQQYKALIEENNNKPASMWKIFKELGATKNKSKGMANCFLVDGIEITDSQDIANEFNRFFVSVASQLKEPNVKPNFETLEKFCDEQVPNGTLFTIPNITKEKVEKYLRNLDLSKATGTDNIGPSKKISNDQEPTQSDPHPTLTTKREITKYIN